MPSSPGAPLLTARAAATLVVAAFACALGGLILGEYQFEGALPYGAGLLFGLVVGELVAELGRVRSWLVALLSAAMVAAALALAVYISTGRGLNPFPMAGWAAIAIGAATVAWRTGGWLDRKPTPETA
jgi:hypothetical protein